MVKKTDVDARIVKILGLPLEQYRSRASWEKKLPNVSFFDFTPKHEKLLRQKLRLPSIFPGLTLRQALKAGKYEVYNIPATIAGIPVTAEGLYYSLNLFPKKNQVINLDNTAGSTNKDWQNWKKAGGLCIVAASENPLQISKKLLRQLSQGKKDLVCVGAPEHRFPTPAEILASYYLLSQKRQPREGRLDWMVYEYDRPRVLTIANDKYLNDLMINEVGHFMLLAGRPVCLFSVVDFSL